MGATMIGQSTQEVISHLLFCFTGLLLDATKNYKYVFLLAGCEVVLSSLVLAICNWLFIKKKPQEPDPPAKMEMAVSDAEMEVLNKAPQENPENKDVVEGTGKVQQETVIPKDDKVKEPESSGVDSVEIDVSKKLTEENGVVVEPESSL